MRFAYAWCRPTSPRALRSSNGSPSPDRLARVYGVDRAAAGHHEEFGVRSFADGGDGRGHSEPDLFDLSSVGDLERPDLTTAVVGEDVVTDQRRNGRAAIQRAAADRAVVADVFVLMNGRGHSVGRLVVVEPVVTLHRAPSEVRAASTAVCCPTDIDLFPLVLTDVGDPQVAGRTVEAEPPRVAQTDRPDLRTGPVHTDEWIVGWHRVSGVASRMRIDPQDLAQPFPLVERPAIRVAAGPSVSRTDVQHAVRTEH